MVIAFPRLCLQDKQSAWRQALIGSSEQPDHAPIPGLEMHPLGHTQTHDDIILPLPWPRLPL